MELISFVRDCTSSRDRYFSYQVFPANQFVDQCKRAAPARTVAIIDLDHGAAP